MGIVRLPTATDQLTTEEWFRVCALTCLGASRTVTRFAYPVPWHVTERGARGRVTVENRSDAVLSAVRFSALGTGLLGLSLPQRVFPGERVSVQVHGVLDADGSPKDPRAMLLLAWRHADGTELTWPIAW